MQGGNTTLRLDPARMQLQTGFVGVYLELNAAEEEIFLHTVDRIGLNDEEVYVKMVTSWERKGRQETQEEIAMNLLQRGMTISETVEITGLTVERVRELQAQLSQSKD